MGVAWHHRRIANALTLAALTLAALAAGGCVSNARLSEQTGLKKGATGDLHCRTAMAIFENGANHRQTIVLAFDPTGAPPPSTARPHGPIGQAPSDAALRFRRYLRLEVQKGGGRFEIGQRILSGQVRAFYRVYNERGEIVSEVADHSGSIRVEVMPLVGGLSPDDWYLSGRFDLLMANDTQLTGRFVARPSPHLVGQYVKEKRL